MEAQKYPIQINKLLKKEDLENLFKKYNFIEVGFFKKLKGYAFYFTGGKDSTNFICVKYSECNNTVAPSVTWKKSKNVLKVDQIITYSPYLEQKIKEILLLYI